MPETGTARDLLVVAIQDLLEGERAWVERLPRLAAPDTLAGYVSDELARSREQRARLGTLLGELGVAAETMPNIWLNAILDDARRDSETIVDGPLRAIAMVGAFRKAKQSERVSYETAIGLAEAFGMVEAVTLLTRSRDEEAAADDALAKMLEALLRDAT